MLFFSIRSQNEKLAKTISDFIGKSFLDFRNENSEKEIEYPIYYYEVVYKATEELAALNNKKFTFLEYRTVGSIWLLGELRYNKISEKTYYYIWANLEVSVRYERDDMVMHHWSNAHQYFSFQLAHISPEFNPVYEQINSQEIDF